MTTAETQQRPATEVPRQEPAPAVEQWPRPDFERQVQRLRAELWTAIRLNKSKADEIAALQDLSFARGIPAAVLAGGQEKLEKLGNEKDAAVQSAQQARTALRKFADDERARFFARKAESRLRLNADISEKFSRAQAAASELIALLREQLGAKAAIGVEEEQIAVWNHAARDLNRSIPAENVNNIPGVALIDSGDSLRSAIEGMLIGDPALRELVRGILTRDAEQRQRAEVRREFLEREAKAGTVFDESQFVNKF